MQFQEAEIRSRADKGIQAAMASPSSMEFV